MWQYVSQAELYHHGIKGQKWGIRRFQNKDGSLTVAGRKRYADLTPAERRKAKIKERNERNKRKVSENLERSRNNGLNVRRVAMSHRLNLEAKFREKGLSEEEAKKAAKKRIKAEVFVAAAAATTVASVMAYNTHKKNSTDRTLDGDIEFQRIVKLARGETANTNHRMYISYDKKDNAKYKGNYGTQLYAQINSKGLGTNVGVYKLNMKANGPVKVASRNRAAKIFADLFTNDPEFRDVAEGTFLTDKYSFTSFNIKANAKKLSYKDLMGKGYDAFNRGLTGKAPSERFEKQLNKFYDALREQGFNAIEDINDKKYSGYKAKDPIITLDGMKLTSQTLLSQNEVADLASSEVFKRMRAGLVRNGAIYAAVKGLTSYNIKAEDRELIRQYKQQHPNTEMSDNEIIKSLKPHRK